jgi:hypothetical protein
MLILSEDSIRRWEVKDKAVCKEVLLKIAAVREGYCLVL